METVRIPTRLLPDVLNLITAKYQDLLDKKAETERRLSDAQYALDTLTRKNTALAEHAAELERQLGEADDF